MSELTAVGVNSLAAASPASYATGRSVIDDARNHLYRGHRDEKTRLTTTITAGATTATFAFARNAIQAGAKLSIGAEDINVWAVTSQTVVSDMERGAFGTTAAEHTAGATVTINAVVSDAELFAALNDELASLSGDGLFRMAASDLTYGSNTAGYALPADFLDIYELRWDAPGVSKNWPLISASEYAVSRDLSTTDFGAGGNALMLYGAVTPGAVMRLRYKAGFNRLTSLADNVVAVAGVHAEALPLLAVGTALRCAAGRPLRRAHTSAQGSSRRAEEVSVTDGLAAPGGLRQLRRDLLNAEVTRLSQRYPSRI